MKRGGSISIWFFIGISLLVNGLLIFGSGVYELIHPPQAQVVLFHLHASIWWGAILAMYRSDVLHLLPARQRADLNDFWESRSSTWQASGK